MFVLDPAGQGLLLMGSTKALAAANWGSIALVTLTAAVGIAALAGGFQGWALRRTTAIERCDADRRRLRAGLSGRLRRRGRLSLIVAVLAMQHFLPAPAAAAKDA